MAITKPRTYSELIRRASFDDRFQYVNLHGKVGDLTHGQYRYLNQEFYSSREWRLFRNRIIERDNGCDLAIPGRDIRGKIIVHHLEPITVDMLIAHDPLLTDPNNAVCVSPITHQAIHYGYLENTPQEYTPRSVGDTIPWR